MHVNAGFGYALAHNGLIDEYEIYLNPLVWAQATVTCSSTARMMLDDVKQFASGVVLLAQLPTS